MVHHSATNVVYLNLNTYDIATITKVLETNTLLKQLEDNIKQL